MRAKTFVLCAWVIVLMVGLLAGESAGLTIYRFGGESLPDPPEAGNDGVIFTQLNWTELDESRGGEAIRLHMDETTIGALKHDPKVNIAPTSWDRGGKLIRADRQGAVMDGDHETMWVSKRFLCSEFRSEAYGGALKCDEGFIYIGTMNIVLGGFFLIDRIRIVSGLETLGSMAKDLRVSFLGHDPSGLYQSQLGPIRPYIYEIRNNREQYLDVELPPHHKTAFVPGGPGGAQGGLGDQ